MIRGNDVERWKTRHERRTITHWKPIQQNRAIYTSVYTRIYTRLQNQVVGIKQQY